MALLPWGWDGMEMGWFPFALQCMVHAHLFAEPVQLDQPRLPFFFLRARPPNLEIAERFSRQQVVQMHIHSSYLHRMTALYAIQVLTESLDVDMLGKVRIGSWRGGPSTHGSA